MDKVILGKTGIEVNKNGFGALPIQRITKRMLYIFSRKHSTMALIILIRQGHILTVRRRLGLHSSIQETGSLSVQRRRPRQRRDSGRIWRRVCQR